jgi:hypothetical protein
MADQYPPLQVKNFPLRAKRRFGARAHELGHTMKTAILDSMDLWLNTHKYDEPSDKPERLDANRIR